MTKIGNSQPLTSIRAETALEERFVAPGKTTYIPIQLTNSGDKTQVLKLSLQGIPSHWIETIPEKIVILPQEQKEISLIVQPPNAPMTQIGRYPFQISLTPIDDDSEPLVVESNLTVAAYEVQGRIGILMDALQFSVAPGSVVSVNLHLINQGLEEDTFHFSLDGIPAAWVSTATSALRMKPGEQKSVSFLIRPAHHSQSRAGRHPFEVHIKSQLTPTETAMVECILTVEAFSDFNSHLQPNNAFLGDKVQIVIDNLGNIPDSYTIAWGSTNPNLSFELVADPYSENEPQIKQDGTLHIRVPPGEKATLNFQSKLSAGFTLIGNAIHPYKVRIEAANESVQTHMGEILNRGIIPVWVVQLGILLLLSSICLAGLMFSRSSLVASQATGTAIAVLSGSTQTVEVALFQTAGATQTAEAILTESAGATQTASVNMTQAAQAGEDDSDGDGLTNAQENEFGTNPSIADSDLDGLSDSAEIAASSNPLTPDTDGDSLTDGDEFQRGTDPLNVDTDADALSDGQEIQLGTDPLNPDTDADGIADGNEDPPCPHPTNPDSDGDGLIDAQDLDPCDPQNPSLTLEPSETIPPTDIPTQTPAVSVTETPIPPAPPTPQIQGLLAFISTRDGNPEIYRLNLADGSVVRLTDNPAIEAQPAWSPDGNRIAFATNRDGNFEIYVMNADGSNLTNLTNHASDDFDPDWSPDGTQLAFVSNRDGNEEIYTMNVDGTNPFNVTNDPANDSHPSWFIHNGILPTVRIAFTSNRDGNNEIYWVNPSGIDPTNLTEFAAEDYSPATFSDSGLIAFTTIRDGNDEIYLMSDDGASLTNLTNQPSSSEWSPTWNGNSDQMIFVSNRDGNQELYLLQEDGQYNLTNTSGDDYDPDWFIP